MLSNPLMTANSVASAAENTKDLSPQESDTYIKLRGQFPNKSPEEIIKMIKGDRTAATPGQALAYNPAGSPAIDQAKAKANEADAMKSGWQPDEWMKNIKESVGYPTASNSKVR